MEPADDRTRILYKPLLLYPFSFFAPSAFSFQSIHLSCEWTFSEHWNRLTVSAFLVIFPELEFCGFRLRNNQFCGLKTKTFDSAYSSAVSARYWTITWIEEISDWFWMNIFVQILEFVLRTVQFDCRKWTCFSQSIPEGNLNEFSG